MASKVSIINSALLRCRGNPIISVTENSDEARKANQIFDESLDHLLQMGWWNFATYRRSLALTANTPTYEWTYEYQLPTSPFCLQVIEAVDGNSNQIEYEVETNKLYANETDISIKYIGRVTDMNKLPALFKEALIYYLAAQFAFSISGSVELMNSMEKKFQYFLMKARGRDVLENPAKERQEVSWVSVRGSSTRRI